MGFCGGCERISLYIRLSGREAPFSGPLIFMTCTFCKRSLLRLMEHPVEIHKLQVPLAAGAAYM